MQTYKVLLVIDKIHTGGAEKILLDFREYLLSIGFEVNVYSLYFSSEKFSFGCYTNSSNVLSKTFQQLNLYLKLRRYVRHFQPDYIYSFLDRSNVLVSLLPAKYQKCLSVHNILSIQYSKLSDALFGIVKKIIENTYNRSGNIILAVSEQVKDDIISTFGVNPSMVKVILNCTNKSFVTTQANEEINELMWDKDYKYILNIGRLSEQKAQWKLLKALRYLQTVSSELKIKLIILGEGDLKERLSALVSLLGLNDVVHILPFNINPFKFIKHADIFVLPSIFEGCPIVLSEVIALEKPFIGSEESIPKELFSNNISVWSDSTYNNQNSKPDFTSAILSDDIELANLIHEHLYGTRKIDSVIACKKWNRYNDKKYQFEAYLQLFGCSVE